MKKLTKALVIGLSSMAFLLSGCGDKPSSSSNVPSSSAVTPSTFAFSCNDDGASIVYERDGVYQKGELVRFKIVLKEGFKLESVVHNNVEIYPGEEDFPYGIIAATTNRIKATLTTNYTISGALTFNQKTLYQDQTTCLGIKAKDIKTSQVKEGLISYETGKGASYNIPNILKGAAYQLSLIVYTAPNLGGPVEAWTTTIDATSGSVSKDIDVNTKKTLKDETIEFPKTAGQIYSVYNVKEGWQADDYIVEIDFKSELSKSESTGASSVSSVMQFAGLSQGNAGNGDVLAFRLLYQDIAEGSSPAEKFYRFQITMGAWTTVDLRDFFTTEEIEGDDVAVLAAVHSDSITFYLRAGGKTENLCTYTGCTIRQNVKYVDCNAWSSSSIGDVTYTGCIFHGGVSSPKDLDK